MIWLFTIISELWFGFEITYYFLDQMLNIVFVAAFGVTVGIGTSSIFFFLCSTILGQNLIHIILHSLLLIFISIGLLQKRIRIPKKLSRFTDIKKPEIIISLIYIVISIYLTWKVYLPAPRSFSLVFDYHLTEELSLISSFHHGVNSGFVNPFYIRHPNLYGHSAITRWLTAFHSSMLQYGFASLKMSLFIPSFLLISSYLIIMFYFALQFNIPYYIAFFVPFISILLSGFGFLRFLHHEKRTIRTNDYVSQSGYGKYPRFHPVFHLLYGFRHTTLTLPLVNGIIYIYLWMIKYKKANTSLMIPFVGFMFGLIMPATQFQTFIGFIVFLLLYTAMQKKSKNYSSLKKIFIYIFIGFLIHFPRYLNIEFLKNSFSLQVQWKQLVQHELIPPFSLWWNNCGVFIIIFLFLSWFQLKSVEYYIFIPSVACFIIFNFWKVQSQAQFNIFIFLSLNYSIGSCIVVATLYRFIKSSNEPEYQGIFTALSILAIISCTLSSILGIHRQINNHKPQWSIGDENLVKWVLEHTSKKDVFIAPIISLNPISALAGRWVYIDNYNLLDYCGFNYSRQQSEYQKLLKNQDSQDISKNVFYIISYNDEQNSISSTSWKEVYKTRDYTIYKNNNFL